VGGVAVPHAPGGSRPGRRWALKDPGEAAAYINAAMEGGDKEDLLMALRDVAEATGGMRRLAGKTGIPRESLYRSLSGRGNPEYSTLTTVVRALGLTIRVEPGNGSGRPVARGVYIVLVTGGGLNERLKVVVR